MAYVCACACAQRGGSTPVVGVDVAVAEKRLRAQRQWRVGGSRARGPRMVCDTRGPWDWRRGACVCVAHVKEEHGTEDEASKEARQREPLQHHPAANVPTAQDRGGSQAVLCLAA